MRDWTHDLEAMAHAVDENTRLVFVANPNNPTGTWNRRGEVESLVASLPRGFCWCSTRPTSSTRTTPSTRTASSWCDGARRSSSPGRSPRSTGSGACASATASRLPRCSRPSSWSARPSARTRVALAAAWPPSTMPTTLRRSLELNRTREGAGRRRPGGAGLHRPPEPVQLPHLRRRRRRAGAVPPPPRPRCHRPSPRPVRHATVAARLHRHPRGEHPLPRGTGGRERAIQNHEKPGTRCRHRRPLRGRQVHRRTRPRRAPRATPTSTPGPCTGPSP